MEIIKQLLRYNTVMKKVNAINEHKTGNGRMRRWFFVLHVSLLRLIWESCVLWAVFLEDLQNWKAPESSTIEDKGLHSPASVRDILASPKKMFFYSGGDQMLVWAAQRGGGVFVLGDIQTSAGHSPEEPDLSLKATLA